MRETNHLFVLTLFFYHSRKKKRELTMDYAIFARTSIMRYRSVIIFLPKILSFRRRKMVVTYHNGAPTTAVRRDSRTASSTLASKGKKKINWIAHFSAGRAFFSPTTPFRCVIRNLLFFVYVFLPGVERKRSDASAPTSMCVCLYLYVRVLEGRRSKWFLIDDGKDDDN